MDRLSGSESDRIWVERHPLNFRNITRLKHFSILMLFMFSWVLCLNGQVRVRGYTRKDGTYVAPHTRSSPDGNPYNNYSFPGNYNPNTGRITTGNPSTYLERYYGGRSSGMVSGAAAAELVFAVQESLTLLGYLTVPVDGNEATSASALKTFQTGHHLKDDGVLTLETLQQLVEALKHLSPGDSSAISGPDGSIPANSSLNYAGNGWDCNRGFYRSGSACVSVEIPANSSLNYAGNGWDCNRGFYRSGSGCVSVEIPANASLNYAGNGWDCNRGFYRSGSACTSVEIPTNASLNYAGNGWDCNRGFYKSASGCMSVEIPSNASLNYAGNGWDCNRGFYRSGSGCTSIRESK